MKNLLLYCLLLLPCLLHGQMTVAAVEGRVDSLLSVIDRTSPGTARFEPLLSLYATGVEGFPLMVLDVYKRLYALASRDNDQITEALAWSFAGQGYRLSGNYVKGLECHLRAVTLAEKSGDESTIGLVLNQQGHIYKDRGENEKALRLYLSSLAHAQKGTSERLLIWPKMNAGAIYLALNQVDSALYYCSQSLEGSRKFDITANDSYTLSNIAAAYSQMGDQEKAADYYRQALQEAASGNSPRYINLTCQSLAEHYRRIGQVDSCIHFAHQAIDVVQGTVQEYLALKPAKLLTDVYADINGDSTLKYLKIYTAANDSLYSTRANQQLQMMTYEDEERQQQLATAQLRARNRFRMSLMAVGLLAFSAIAFVLYRGNRQKVRANQTLQRQKEELQQALSKLKSTQAQLVQSEKMASLGEMTAGIAHEIKNPLNFVNNFAEVSGELFDELKHTTDPAQQAELITMLQDNLGKINEHGKRADAIVKSMLQHSRTSSGEKEPTDLNALADEYLRLAYHGLRARDKSFNANFSTQLDPDLPKVNVVPQDVGRVLLNLVNNAFQAVAEKSVSDRANYVPEVTVSTGVEGKNVYIQVADNGPGIPAAIADKIFQPFFTTKPTGQGTGLGLSLSYDIVKTHGGQLTAENAPGGGTLFTIRLPR